ncbi:MAG TPA: hypothetical protein VHH36_00050, partial [Candidatus Thermoplasmatota archaeon]|nr:hypothetical protein [Candidatus Thermoplasmatota archaeon]
ASATGLAPQAVSEAMRELESNGLARAEAVRGGQRGRPSLRYRAPGGAGGALARFAAGRRAALAQELAALDAVEEQARGLGP